MTWEIHYECGSPLTVEFQIPNISQIKFDVLHELGKYAPCELNAQG